MTEPRAVGALLRAIDGYRANIPPRSSLQILPYVFLRSSELRFSTWSQIDFNAAEWRVPARNMKMKEMHIVHLSTQVIALLRELHKVTGDRFDPCRTETGSSAQRKHSECALRDLGYTGDEMPGHGFRTVASTFLNEQGWHPGLIELQLAHMWNATRCVALTTKRSA